MALDKVIDSAVLDADLLAVADAIRAKGGTSEQLAFPDGFVSAVEGIQVGGGANGVIQVPFSGSKLMYWENMPEDIHLNFLVESTFGCSITDDQTEKRLNIFITGVTPYFGQTAFSGGQKATVIKSIDVGGNVVECYWDESFRYCANLEVINAILDFNTATKWDRTFINCYALEEIRFLENSITASGIPLGQSSLLSDDSLVSVANALVVPVDTTCTVTLHATSKARCDEILGTVSAVTDGDTTYDFFTQDETGTVTLTEFITTTKGWTLA